MILGSFVFCAVLLADHVVFQRSQMKFAFDDLQQQSVVLIWDRGCAYFVWIR
jgi:hypothetical protein